MKLALAPLALLLPAAALAEDAVKLLGDARVEYATLHREDRNGKEDITDEFRGRLRLGLEAAFNDAWSARLRAAGRYTSNDLPGNSAHFAVHPYASTATGLDWNEGTVDEANIAWEPNKAVSLRIGRQQTGFALDDLTSKSLDRKDSPSTDVSWTDGVHLKLKHASGWSHSVIAQHNHEDGATNAQRSPLNYQDRDAGLTWFYGLENKKAWGPIVQRGLDISYLPDGLRVRGVNNPATETYAALVGRLVAAWPLNGDGFEFRLGGEYGQAFSSPSNASQRLGAQGDTGRNAFQLSANLMEIAAGHSLALVYGEADAGWLLSPDFGPNADLLELRYQWTLNKQQAIEIRARRREDLEQLTHQPQRRVDEDVYLRYTYKL